MINKLFTFLKNLKFFTTSYSINVFPEPLSEDEEKSLIIRVKEGNKDARSTLIEHNLRLVAHIVKKFNNYSEDTDDLISIGTIGLIKGIDSYSLNKGVKLTTYIAKCAENEILMFLRSNKKNISNVSLNDTIGYDKDGNEISFIDIIDSSSKELIDIVYLKDNINLLKKYIQVLNKREKEIIILRYGLMNNDELTQKDIAKKMHISRSYVSRIEKRALIKMLREFIKSGN